MVVEREGAAGTQSQIRVNQNGAAVFSFVYVCASFMIAIGYSVSKWHYFNIYF